MIHIYYTQTNTEWSSIHLNKMLDPVTNIRQVAAYSFIGKA
jgi:hypothetical protein